jgi:hypothetical protein
MIERDRASTSSVVAEYRQPIEGGESRSGRLHVASGRFVKNEAGDPKLVAGAMQVPPLLGHLLMPEEVRASHPESCSILRGKIS